MRAYLSFVVVFAIHYGVAFAQLTSSENTAKPYIPSWDTYEFMKYGNVGLRYILAPLIIPFRYMSMRTRISTMEYPSIMPPTDFGSTTRADFLGMDGL